MRIARRTFLSGSFAALAVPRAAAAAPLAEPGPAARAELARLAQAFLASGSAPSVSVAFAQGGHVGYAAAFGTADRFDGTPAAPSHLYRLASVSKPVTSVAIFTLIDAGRLSLDARVLGPGTILGEPGLPVPQGSKLREITVRHLLTHSAGGWPNDATDPMSGRPERTHAELIAEALRRGISAPPGAKFAYSNFGFCLLGRIIEKATGRPYEDYVREAVLAPAGAAGMTIAGNGIAGRKPDEVRYHGQGNDNPYSFNVARMDSHGGWIATAAQIARFADAADVPLLSPASATEMVRPSAADPAYACGWRISKSGNRWHAGSLPGTTTLLVRTRRGLCWAGLVNTRNRNDGLARALDRLMWAMARAVPEWRA